MNSVVVRSAMSIGQFLLLIIQTLMSPIIFFTSTCFESKTRVSALVPCVLELHLELRRFIEWGSAGIPNTGESALLLCRTYATIAYVRDNAVCCMKYAVREYASSLFCSSLISSLNFTKRVTIHLDKICKLIFIEIINKYNCFTYSRVQTIAGKKINHRR